MKCNTFKFSSYDCKHRFLLWDKRMCQVLINVYFFVDDDLTLCMKTCWNAVARQFLIHSQHHDIYPVVGSWTKMFTSQRLAFVLYFRILMLSRNFEFIDNTFSSVSIPIFILCIHWKNCIVVIWSSSKTSLKASLQIGIPCGFLFSLNSLCPCCCCCNIRR